MIRIHVTDRQGDKSELSASDGEVLMNVLHDNGKDVEAVCGGCCSCATCHVYVDNSWLEKLEPQAENEAELLSEMSHTRANSRLSCEIHLSPELSGLSLTVAPSED